MRRRTGRRLSVETLAAAARTAWESEASAQKPELENEKGISRTRIFFDFGGPGQSLPASTTAHNPRFADACFWLRRISARRSARRTRPGIDPAPGNCVGRRRRRSDHSRLPDIAPSDEASMGVDREGNTLDGRLGTDFAIRRREFQIIIILRQAIT